MLHLLPCDTPLPCYPYLGTHPYLGTALTSLHTLTSYTPYLGTRPHLVTPSYQGHPRYAEMASQMGVPHLSVKLNQMLLGHIRACLPELRTKAASALVRARGEIAKYGHALLTLTLLLTLTPTPTLAPTLAAIPTPTLAPTLTRP